MLLKVRSTGLRVKALQTVLQVPITGVFGNITDQAVRAFQRSQGLVVDGLVGANTFKALMLNPIDVLNQNIKITASMLDTPKPDKAVALMFSPKAFVKVGLGLGGIRRDREILQLDNTIKLCHFIGQVKEEVGYNFNDVENMNYSVQGLKNTFRVYRDSQLLAVGHGRSGKHPANQEAIANHAYANRYGNGSPESGDGWNYKGAGSLQVTFKNNNKALDAFVKLHNFKGSIPSFVESPISKSSNGYSLVSGAIFWAINNIGNKIISNSMVTKKDSYACTRIINKHTHSYDKRWKHTKKLAKLMGLSISEY